MSDVRLKVVELLQAEGIRLHALFYRLTLSVEVADDLLQELCVRLIASETFAGAERPVGFAVRVAVHLGLDWRKQKRRQPVELPDQLRSHEEEPSVRIGSREEIDRILSVIEGLREPLREIVILRYLDGETYEDIAAVLGKSPHQIRGMAHKGVREIRARVREPGGADRQGASHARHI